MLRYEKYIKIIGNLGMKKEVTFLYSKLKELYMRIFFKGYR